MRNEIRTRRGLVLAAMLLAGAPVMAQGPAPDATVAAADRAATALVAKLTVAEKIDQLLNAAPAIPRLNIPA